jgi:hypothetical protein
MFMQGRSLWTIENIERLRSAFTDSPRLGPDAFLEKFSQQLSGRGPDVIQLAAEMLWVLFLFPRKLILPARKREIIIAVWNWSDTPLHPQHRLLGDSLLGGIGSAGTAFNTQRDRELEGLIDASLALKSRLRGEALSPWEAADVIDNEPRATKRHIRNILLHLLFPEEFERVASLNHKREIGTAFLHLLKEEERYIGPANVDVDIRLKLVRNALEASRGKPIDFYDREIRAEWDPRGGQGGGSEAPPAPRADSMPQESDVAPIREPALNLHAWAGIWMASWLAERANVRDAPPELILAAYLVLAEHPQYASRSALVLHHRAAVPNGGNHDGRLADFLLQRYGLSRPALPEPLQRVSPGPTAFRIIAQAERVRTSVASRIPKDVSPRHIIAVLLGPGPDSVAEVLTSAGVDVPKLHALLYDLIVAQPLGESVDGWRTVLLSRSRNEIERLTYAGFSTDALPGLQQARLTREDDRLGVMRDVTALCEVLAARETRPPLAVGLFADWGTGKSFFMELMQHEIERLGKANPDFYCQKVVQVWFNAWHYMDTGLWASLAARVFEELARQLDEWNLGGQEQRNLFDELQESRGMLAEARQEKTDAEERVKNIRHERAQKEIGFKEAVRLAAGAAVAELSRDEVVTEELREAGLRLGLSGEQVDIAHITVQARAVAGLKGRAWAVGRAILQEPAKLGAMTVVLIAAVTVAAVLERYGASVAAQATVWVAAVAGLLAAFAPVYRHAMRAVRWIEEVSARFEQKRAAEVHEAELAAQRERARLDEREREAQARVDVLELEVEELRTGRRLHRFIMERHTSGEYREQLGIVNRIRNDFEQLSNLLSAPADTGAPRSRSDEAELKPLPRIDRIVLYIDDLDRCPEERVVEVLQAVHLLLAFPLFVVVVGVDSRWLLLSLQDHYAVLRSPSGSAPEHRHSAGEEEWSTTPQNYLEKIFQIPFTLRPMEPVGFENLVHSLLPLTDPTAGGVPDTRDEDEEDDFTGEEEEPTVASGGGAAPLLQEPVVPPPPNPQGLTVEAHERQFILALQPLLASPRALKRFTNIYRFLRVQQRGDDLRRFRGTPDEPGEFQVVALLLASLIGYPTDAAILLRRVLTLTTNSWWDWVDALGGVSREAPGASGERGRAALHDALRQIQGSGALADHPPEVFVRWAREVARFSFQAGRVLSVSSREPGAPAGQS